MKTASKWTTNQLLTKPGGFHKDSMDWKKSLNVQLDTGPIHFQSATQWRVMMMVHASFSVSKQFWNLNIDHSYARYLTVFLGRIIKVVQCCKLKKLTKDFHTRGIRFCQHWTAVWHSFHLMCCRPGYMNGIYSENQNVW